MLKKSRSFYLLFLTVICMDQVNAGIEQNSLQDLCASGKDFWETYKTTCGNSQNDDAVYETRGRGKPTHPSSGSKPPSLPSGGSGLPTLPPGGNGTPTITDGPITAFCGIAQCLMGQNCSLPGTSGKRFMSADDIPESDQEKRIAKVRNLNRVDQTSLCTSGQEVHINRLLNSLGRVLHYFGTLRNLEVNFPLLASRTIQGQIAIILEKIRFVALQSTLLTKLRNLEEQSKNISKKLVTANSDSWNWIDRMISTTYFWKMPNCEHSWKDWAILGNKERHPVSYFQDLPNYRTHHEPNNKCHYEMIQDCGLSQECADLLMDKTAKLTTLGHILRFFEVAVKMDCVRQVDFVDKFSTRGTTWENVLEAQCSLMWNEANIIADAEFPTGYKGLFLVHGTSCAFMGYPNFLQIDWMNSIMTWMNQTNNGCIAPDTKSGEVDSTYDHIAENGEWCAHWETMMGTQLLITNLRYILETCAQDITQN